MSSNTIISWRPNNVIRQLPWSLDSKAALGILLILATFSLVGWLYLTQASAVTATSYRIDELRLELDQLKNQNAALSLEIAQFQALSHVEKRALELGFRPTTNIRYLSVSSYPNQQSADSIAYDPLRLNSRPLDSASFQTGEAIWWDTLIDGLTAWLVGE
jgi:hypothetical protein